VRSFIGHWSLTAFVDEKLEVVDTFFSGETSPEERQALLREYNVRYVFYSDTERKIGDFSPDDAPYLILVYESPTISLYAVRE
jgi:uncharacterized membrane protein